VHTESTRYLMELTTRPAAHMARGKGSLLWDSEGKRYLDFIQGWAVNALGHCPDVLTRALSEQLGQVINVGPAHHNALAPRLAAALAEKSGLNRVFMACSGAEANEGAVKLARKWGQKRRGGAYAVITTLDGFHGRTLAMTCATGKPGFDRAFPPAVEGFPKVPYGDVEAVARAIDERTVAVMVEPIQGEAGVVVPPAGYLRELRALCDRAGILLIADEIQTGLARTGPLFACQADGVLPDIMTLGKGLGGGLPVSALLAREDVACFELGDHGSTFTGNALLCAGALAVLGVLDSAEHAAKRRESSLYLEETLRVLALELGAELRGRGHLWALVLPRPDAVSVRERAFERGLLVNAARPHVLRFMPALDVEREHVDEMAEIVREVAAAAHDHVSTQSYTRS
jgi:acetylornithine/N-succinyldiaminopimelate aminotransferase